ncbi:MAG: 30S ribosome-binding factor RbfA [Burkholderiaceae bacterium]
MKRRRKPSGNRAQRVAEQFHHEVAELIRGSIKDPRVGMVTVTGVDLTADYAYLTVHVSVLPDDAENVEKTMAGLRQAAGFVRSQLGRRVPVHTTPEVRFVHDRTTEQAMAMSQLIDQALAHQGRTDDAQTDTDDAGAGDEPSDQAGPTTRQGGD